MLFRKSETPVTLSGKIDSVLGPNTSYNGTIKSDENLRIDCIYQGYIETAGNVIVGPSAQVFADIVANAVQVWGTVCGNIKTGGLLEILPTGRVWGDVDVLSLTIDEGGIFRGRCTIAGSNIEPLKLLDASVQETAPNE